MKRFFTYLTAIVLFCSTNCIAQPTLWGMTQQGGQYGFGEIFKMATGSTSITIPYSFFGYTGGRPEYTSLVLAGNGKYYGMTQNGGINGQGVIFSYIPSTGTYKDEYNFTGANGKWPYGSLVIGPRGKLYGMTTYGGASNYGVIFCFDTLDNYNVLYTFSSSTNGYNPTGSLLYGSNGLFYGMTPIGGANAYGVLFSVDTSGNYNVLYNFQSSTGYGPYGSLIKASNGLLYGMTSQGGTNLGGVIFSFDPLLTTYSNLYSLPVSASPYGALLQASNGKLYGMTTPCCGSNAVLFSYNISPSTFTTLHTFANATGNTPYGNLIQVNGKLYGLANIGGSVPSYGAVFCYNITASTYTMLHALSSSDGTGPFGSLVAEGNGKLLGLTNQGGLTSSGTLFECDTLGGFVKKLDFGSMPNGGMPSKSLFQARDGRLYGMTQQGGTNNVGVIFYYDPKLATFNKIYNFSLTTGAEPAGSLIQLSDGKLYGMTSFGGTHSSGVIFSCDTVGNYSDLYNFSYSGGTTPSGSLLMAANGKLYGLTNGGGTYGYGTLFSYKVSSGSYVDLHNFQSTDGRAPNGSLIQGTNGKLYGMASNGGSYGDGTIFNYDTSGVYTTILSFNYSIGGIPQDNLLQASNGKLYGLASVGGTYGNGTLFSVDTSNIFHQLYNFNNVAGNIPFGSCIQASNAKLYGTASAGLNGFGVVFEYDTAVHAYIDKYNFNSIDGSNPCAGFIEISTMKVTNLTANNITCNGSNNGSASIIVSGGSGPYTYLWTPGGQITSFVTGMTAGNYTVTVNDSINTTIKLPVTILQPAVLASSPSVIANVSCYTGSNGNANANPTGGTSPYTYSWWNGTTVVSTSNPTTGILSAGSYTVTVTDKNSCTATASVSITQPASALSTSTPSVISNVTCNGFSNGDANTTAGGGTGAYTYSWFNGSTVVSTADPSGPVLTVGTFTVTVKDNNGCSVTSSVGITQPAALNVSNITSTQTTCGGASGTATETPSGGTSAYTYLWSNSGGGPNIIGLSAGLYSVTVTDAHACTATASVSVTTPNGPRDSITHITNNLCFDANNGSITVGVNRGAPPYTFAWSTAPTQTNATATSLTSGTYTVIITDANNCASSTHGTLTDPPQLRDSIISSFNGCGSLNNGTATTGVIGGTGAYTYLWNTTPSQTSANATGLSAGSYIVSVNDQNNCTVTASCAITPGTIPSITFNLAADSVQCDTVTQVLLTSFASPAGGAFSGTDVSANAFHPHTAGDGKYVIKYNYTNGSGCSDSATQSIRVKTCSVTGIGQVVANENKIVIYPNPNIGQFYITGLAKGATVELYNEIGMLIESTKAANETMTLNISDKANGMYLVRMISSDGTSSTWQKVIKLQ